MKIMAQNRPSEADRTTARRHGSTPTSRRATRRVVGLAGALALTATGLVGFSATSAQAVDSSASGTFDWGFRENFRSYVGGTMNTATAGTRITVGSPATFDSSAAPAISGVSETRPYVFAASSASGTSATDLTIASSGSVHYNFPAHFFTMDLANPTVVVSGTSASVYADLSVTTLPAETVSGGSDVLVGQGGTANVTLAADGKSASVQVTGLTLSSAGSTAVSGYLAAGAALDPIGVTVTFGTSITGGTEEPPTPAAPSVRLSKAVADPAGDTITVTGTGFLPSLNIGTRPPYSGVPAGVYIAFGKFADVWKPSAGAASSTRATLPQADGGVKWAVPVTPLPAGTAYVQLAADGSFTATVAVKQGFTGEPTTGNYGIYTYPGSGGTAPSYETYTPVTFSTTPEQPEEPEVPGDTELSALQTITTQVVDTGALTLSVAGSTVTLPSPALNSAASALTTSGPINKVTVADLRSADPGWSVTGVVSTFTGSAGTFSGNLLGWTPALVSKASTQTVTIGSAAQGLGSGKSLGSAAAGQGRGTAVLGAELGLELPTSTPVGSYTATLTLTAI